MSDAYLQVMTEHRRLALLRFLADPESGGTCNDSIMYTIVNEKFGVRSSRDQIKSALTWLQEQDLIKLQILESGTFVATIRQRGEEIAKGILTVPGVWRRSPEA